MLTWKQIISVVAGNTFEFYDIAVYAAIAEYIAKALQKIGISHAVFIVWGVFALRFLVRPIGGILIGWYADHCGRRSALILSSTLTGTATLLMAFLPTTVKWATLAPFILMVLQMVQAFSFGGEYPTIIAYLFANSKVNQHAKISALIVSSSIVGVLISLIVTGILKFSLSIEAMQDFGWRIPIFLGAINLAISIYFRWQLQEKITNEKREKYRFDARVTSRIFLITIPASVIFYVQALAGNLLKSVIHNEIIKSIFPIFLNSFLLVILLFVGLIVDKYSSPRKAMNLGVYLLIVMATPLYFALSRDAAVIVVFAQLSLAIIAALILANLAAVLFMETASNCRATEIGVGYNLASTIFGGLSPLIVATLVPYGAVFAGLYVAVSGLAFLLVQASPEHNAVRLEKAN